MSKEANDAASRSLGARMALSTRRARLGLLGALAAGLVGAMLLPGSALAFNFSFIGGLHTVTPISSTVPANGDVNPYGIATVPNSIGTEVRGDQLISNFNDKENQQGTGTTIVQIAPGGGKSLFAQISPAAVPSCTGGVGLTTALAILPHGYVVVGSLPTSNGSAETAKPGCLIVLDPWGHVVKTIAGGPINGPWDMTAVSAFDHTALFVTNVLNGTVEHGETPTNGGTVVRIDLDSGWGHAPEVTSERIIATGFPERTDEAALVIGPTGDALSPFGVLYVADTLDNRIAAVPFALFRQFPIGGGGITVTQGGHLKAPLGMALAPNGDILTTNGGDGNIVETTPFGWQIRAFDTGIGEGGLFGLTPTLYPPGVYLVNDVENALDLLH